LSKVHDELRQAEQFRHGSTISPGLRIKGQISGNEDLFVSGTIEGAVELGDGVLTVGPSGKLGSETIAREVIVYGEVRGNLNVRDRTELKKEGSIVGDLLTGRILIEDGAHFKGSIEIARDRDASQQKPPQTTASTAAGKS
jgi:cytoskeletal protein CcmA (bactofilin family)